MEVVGTIVTIVVIIFVLAAETNGGKYQGQNPQTYHDQPYDHIDNRKYRQNTCYYKIQCNKGKQYAQQARDFFKAAAGNQQQYPR